MNLPHSLDASRTSNIGKKALVDFYFDVLKDKEQFLKQTTNDFAISKRQRIEKSCLM